MPLSLGLVFPFTAAVRLICQFLATKFLAFPPPLPPVEAHCSSMIGLSLWVRHQAVIGHQYEITVEGTEEFSQPGAPNLPA